MSLKIKLKINQEVNKMGCCCCGTKKKAKKKKKR